MGIIVTMNQRQYFSSRTGKLQGKKELTIEFLRKLFYSTFQSFENKGYFQEYFGIDCTDGFQPGKCGNMDSYLLRKIRKENLFPISKYHNRYTEDDIFDMIEFLFDHISEPVEASGHYHSWNDCGNHYSDFKEGSSKQEYLMDVNDYLKDYKDGFELSDEGEILQLPDEHMESILKAETPIIDEENINSRIDAAVKKFRLRSSSFTERRHAISDLASVFEFLKPQIQKVLNKKDESDLFQIANNFGIRHHNRKQKIEYDQAIWLSWMFYFYLATIHAALRLIEKDRLKKN